MAADNGIHLNLLKFHIKEECSSTNIKVEEVDEEIMQTFEGPWVHQKVDGNELLENENRNLEKSTQQLLYENLEESSPVNIKLEEADEKIIKADTEVSGGLWVRQCVYIEKLLGNKNQNGNLENSAEQFLNENPGINKEAFEDDSNIWEGINNLSTNCQKDNENEGRNEKDNENIQNVKINNTEEKEKLKFLHNDNNCLSTGTLNKMLVSQKIYEKDVIWNHAKGKKQKSECHDYNTTEKKYKCNECSYAAAHKCNLLSHIKALHTNDKAYKCNECSYAAAHKSNLLSHINARHTMKKVYKCNECSYATGRKSNLLSHTKFRHTRDFAKPYKCNERFYPAVEKHALVCHIKTRLHNIIQKVHKCNECSYEATKKSFLITHVRSCHTILKSQNL